jgi:uncharacterized protein GlcG (DUF336 family)
MKLMTLESANRIIETAQKGAARAGGKISVAVVDGTGQLVAFSRADGALPASAELARVKAETAFLFAMATKDLAAASALATALARPVAFFGGGIPLIVEGRPAGAVGVAGGMPDQDHEVAAAAAEAF